MYFKDFKTTKRFQNKNETRSWIEKYFNELLNVGLRSKLAFQRKISKSLITMQTRADTMSFGHVGVNRLF